MSSWEVWIIIILVLGVIASNLAVLRYSAKFKLPQFGPETKPKPQAQTQDLNSEDAEDADSAQSDTSAKFGVNETAAKADESSVTPPPAKPEAIKSGSKTQ